MKKLKKEIFNATEYYKSHNNESIASIATKYGVDRHSLGKYIRIDLSKYFYSKYYDCYIYLNDLEVKAIEDFDKNKLSFAQIYKKYGYTESRMKDKLIAINLDASRNYKINFNRNAFKKIETEEDAYILGFILADGYINEDRGFFSIKLNSRDEDVLVKIGKYLEYDGEIKTRIHNITKNEEKEICFNSKEIVSRLKSYNLFQGKSLREVPYEKINPNLLRHYIRGILDGDGYISKGEIKLGFCGSEKVLNFILNSLKITLSLDCKNIVRFDNKSNIYRLDFTKKDCVIKILKYLYKGSNIYLDRKYQLALKILNCHV